VKILHVVASPRGEQSNTLRVSQAFLDSLAAQRDDIEVEVVDLFNFDLPALAGDNIEAKYTLMMGSPVDGGHEESWRQIETLIEHFLSADAYVLSVPMWNFSIPYVLKYYIDCIVQPGYVFSFNEFGMPVPLVHDRKMVCVTSRGSDYSPGSPSHPYDFQEPYLRAIFGFIGITDLTFIHVQAADMSTRRDTSFETAAAEVQSLVASAAWSGPPRATDATAELSPVAS